MGPKPLTPKSNDLFRQRLDELVNLCHPLVQLAGQLSCHTARWGISTLQPHSAEASSHRLHTLPTCFAPIGGTRRH